MLPSGRSRAQLPPGQGQEPIFRRFTTPPRRSETRLRIFEAPVVLWPQADPHPVVSRKAGIGYTVGAQPFNRAFLTAGFDFAALRWRPSNPDVASAEVHELDVHQNLNFWLGRVAIVSLGVGIGVLDGLVQNTDGSFEHNLVPYIPFRLGVGFILWDKVYVGLRGVAVPFFGKGHEIGQSRLLLGLGWVY